MRHGSLFSGIGGFDLAAECMGWDNVFHCEWMPFPRKILSHYWPEAISYHDITTTDFRQHLGQIDILTGGFPCQPYSAAGKRKGKDDDRHLWPHMLRCIREVKPRWVVGENVFGLATWNGGLVFEEVCAELETEGYAVQPFVLPAAAVNAPHRRDRVWFVAYAKGFNDRRNCAVMAGTKRQARETGFNYANSQLSGNGTTEITSYSDLYGLQQRNRDDEEHTSQGRQYAQRDTQQSYGDGDAADATNCGCRGRNGEEYTDGRERVLQDECRWSQVGGQIARCCGEWDATDATAARLQRSNWCEQALGELTIHGEPYNWQNFPTQSPICCGDDGIPAQLDGITFPKWRAESIKGYGNAIVPQVALQIFKAIQQYEAL